MPAGWLHACVHCQGHCHWLWDGNNGVVIMMFGGLSNDKGNSIMPLGGVKPQLMYFCVHLVRLWVTVNLQQ